MEQKNAASSGAVVCVKIGMGDRDYFMPMDKIEGVCINPELVRVPEAPDFIVGLSLEDRGPVPYIGLEDGGLCENETGWKCGVKIKNADGSVLGILCTRIEEDVEVAPEVLEEQVPLPLAELWGSVEH